MPATGARLQYAQFDLTNNQPKESHSMKKLLALALIGAFAAIATPAFAANVQQERMKTCNAKKGDKKGDAYKAFMKDCLSAEKKAYDTKMGACNTKSKGMKGDERKKFMSACMSAK